MRAIPHRTFFFKHSKALNHLKYFLLFLISAPKDFPGSTDIKIMNEMSQKTIPDDFRVIDPYANRRSHLRSVFTYPVEFKIFTQNPVLLRGILRDISMGGSCLEFEDPYKRIILDEAANSSVKLTLSVPGSEKVYVLSKIKWITRIENTATVKIGIEFSDLSQDQYNTIEKLIGMKNKDHNMMWNLWEEYQK